MQINRHMIVPLEGFADIAQVMGAPRGSLFEFGINPWNGNIVVSWQDNPTSRFFIRLALAQFSKYPDLFDERAVQAYHEGKIDLSDLEPSPFLVDALEVA